MPAAPKRRSRPPAPRTTCRARSSRAGPAACSENPAFEAAPGQLGEEALNGIQPGGGGRREMKDKPRMPGEPGANFGVLVGGVIVEHDVDHLAGRNVGFDGIEKAYEFLVTVTLHAAADDLAFQDVECGEEGGGAVPLVIMGHGAAAALLHRQAGLGAVERLNLRLLVD